MLIVSIGDSLHEMSNLINFSSAELALRVITVKVLITTAADNSLIVFVVFQWRQFAWNVNPVFWEKLEKYWFVIYWISLKDGKVNTILFQLPAVILLLKYGADVDAKDMLGFTPLFLATGLLCVSTDFVVLYFILSFTVV